MQQKHARGIYRAPHLTSDGWPYLKAIDSRNRVVARAVVYPWDSEREMAAMLRRVLNRLDPTSRR